jgi:hypothetical protein
MLIKLKVHAGSKTRLLTKKSADSYEAWVRAPAENGRANQEVLGALAGALGIEAKRLHIVKGATSPSKIVKVLGGD